MANKWNTTDIEKISTAFTQKNLQKCFQENDTLSGEEIVSATAFPQINYFVLREIFSRWEEESGRLRSPWFDFNAPEVQKSFADFRNTLSRYILVKQEDFAGLLENAVRKTLELYLRPEAFFVADFRNLPDFKLTRPWLHKNQVFFKQYDWLIRDLGKAVQGDFIYANQALEEVKRLLGTQTHDFSAEVDRIAREAGLEAEAPKAQPPVKEPENDNLSFFERLVANPPRPTSEFREPEVSPFERIVHKVKAEAAPVAAPVTEAALPAEPVPVKEPAPAEVRYVSTPVAEEVTALVAEPVAVQAEPVTATPVRTEVVQTRVVIREETKSIFEGLNIPTLNDRLSTEERNSLADVHQRSRIDSLKGSMTLNQRFAFLNSLFGADLNSFEQALSQVEQCTTFDQARDVLETRYAGRHSWNLQGEDVKEFLALVKRRFS
ncbi:hypothetical protein [Leadbetterella sp. DM7]|uniref:hypothetical protein n=1 Tax=Leadbetterella sp. DM7 TaxID=3235085 RepID=UPI00349E9A1B